MTFKDKVVAITGAAGGIGQSLCRYFIDEGAKVAAIDKKASVESIGADLMAVAGTFAHAVADVSEPDEVARAFASLAGALGPVDILVNNAGGSNHSTFARTDPAGWRRRNRRQSERRLLLRPRRHSGHAGQASRRHHRASARSTA